MLPASGPRLEPDKRAERAATASGPVAFPKCTRRVLSANLSLSLSIFLSSLSRRPFARTAGSAIDSRPRERNSTSGDFPKLRGNCNTTSYFNIEKSMTRGPSSRRFPDLNSKLCQLQKLRTFGERRDPMSKSNVLDISTSSLFLREKRSAPERDNRPAHRWSWINSVIHARDSSCAARELFLESPIYNTAPSTPPRINDSRLPPPAPFVRRSGLIEVRELPSPTAMNILIPNFVCLREKFEECPALTRPRASSR